MRSFPPFVVGIVLLVVAFLPPVVEAAEQNENVHFGEHLLILLAGLSLGYAARILLRSHVAPSRDLKVWGSRLTVVGLILFLATMVPAFDALADTTMAIHVLEHAIILGAGGLIGLGLLGSSVTRQAWPAGR